MSKSVLIVEDTASTGILYQSWLKKAGISARCVEDGASAMAELRKGSYRLMLLDLQLPDINGLEILGTLREDDVPVSVIVVTSSGSLNTAVDVMRAGAYDFIVKPAAEERLVTTVKNALEHKILETAAQEIKESSGKSQRFDFIGSSLPMLAVYNTIKAVARSNASVFITGESGTGKELCAVALHKNGPRRNKPFVALNCAAIPDNLIESELFGHVKGAFTGATSDREGAATSADGGTLFLDELCEMDLSLQSKLLRFLQTGQVQKVGSDRAKKVDVRVVCATNREPLREVEEGRLREDLYYRLHVVGIHLPPLRERDVDIVEIAEQFLKAASNEEGKSFETLSQDAIDALLSHSWPGNVRELQNVIRNAVILNEGNELTAKMLSLSPAGPNVHISSQTRGEAGIGSDAGSVEISLDQPFALMERTLIEAAIAQCNGSIPRAADLLGLSPSTIYRKKDGWV
jgi:two-component system repressor protein LuxO